MIDFDERNREHKRYGTEVKVFPRRPTERRRSQLSTHVQHPFHSGLRRQCYFISSRETPLHALPAMVIHFKFAFITDVQVHKICHIYCVNLLYIYVILLICKEE